MKDKIFGVLQRVGRSFMLPIAILPVAGLFLGIGGSFTNETMLETYGLMGVMGPGTFINAILQVLNAAGSIVFDNLPIIFAMGVAIGMAKQEKEVAALSAVNCILRHACDHRRDDHRLWCARPVRCDCKRAGHQLAADGRVRRYHRRPGRCRAAQ